MEAGLGAGSGVDSGDSMMDSGMDFGVEAREKDFGVKVDFGVGMDTLLPFLPFLQHF